MLFFKKLIVLLVSLSLLWSGTISSAQAWSLKTHVWIAQQVLNDAADGQLTIAGRNYAIPPNILNALLSHPERFRMGSMGPDVFPDPIVGQMTTHPGVDGGWQTDDWLKHLLGNAKTAEELAFVYGFVVHAAGDIFAHTYVDTYAGDIFVLTDGEREVELRHFVLEKYIESLTPHPVDISGRPINLQSDLGTATSFLRDTLIKGGDVSRQNLLSKAGYHLTAMHEVRNAVVELQKGTQDVISTLTSWAQKYFEQQLKLEADLASGKLAVEAAKLSVSAEEVVLRAKRDAYQAALTALGQANEIVQKHPELITANEQLLAAQIKLAADAAAEATRIAAQAASAISSIQNALTGVVDELAGLVCDIIGGVLPKCKELRDKISDLRRQIDVWNAQKVAAERLRDETARARDELRSTVDRLKAEYERAVKGIAEKTYEAAIFTAETEMKTQEQILDLKKKALAEAEAVSERLSNELQKVIPIVAEIKKAIDRYNLLTLLVQKWIDDIDVGMEEYIKAGHRAGLLMLSSSGNPLKEYTDWYACYGQVFQAVPKEIGQAGCLVRNFVNDVKSEYDRVIDDLPEIVRWIVAPTREVRKRVEEKVKPELEKATFRLVGFLTDPRTAEFLELLTHPKNATRKRLNEVYSRDESGKRLITFPDVASIVERDLHIEGGTLTPEKFPALTHTVTLAKLTLLGPDELNRLVRDLAGNHPFIPPGGVFPQQSGNYSILMNAVRSIDGNHQWQAYGLPYPRRLGVSHSGPGHFHYGQDGFRDASRGLPIWTNVYLREKVFLRLFPDAVIGALGERQELRWKNYLFPSCAQNPFPQTQDPNTGRILSQDSTCTSLAMPDRNPGEFQPATADEFTERYMQCGKPVIGVPHWTVAGSYGSEASVRRAIKTFQDSFPDMNFEAWRPRGHNKYWTIMVATCTTRERAQEARDIVVRRGIARDAFVWRPGIPWEIGSPLTLGNN